MRSNNEGSGLSNALVVTGPAIFVILWATGFIGSRLSAPYAEPLSFLFVRFIIAAVLLAILAVALSARWPDKLQAFHAFVAGSLIQGVYLGSVFWAIYWGMPAGVAALITGLQPLLTAVLAPHFLGEHITLRHWLGLLTGLAGVALVVWPKLTFTAQGMTPATVGACFLGMSAITIGAIYQKRFIADLDLRSGNMWQFIGGAAVVGLGALLTENFEITWNAPVIFSMAWLVLVLSLGAISLLYLMFRKGEVSKVTGLFYLVPAVTALIAWLMFDETLLVIQVLGMAICAFGVFLATKKA